MSISARSMLYQLPPIAKGTPHVEGLSGYLSRLATKHSVTTVELIGLDVFPIEIAADENRRERRRLFRRTCYLMDGSETYTQQWVNAVERATMLTGLGALTLLPYTKIFNNSWLRRKRAWCALCLEAWRHEGREPYEPLIWSSRIYNVCTLHSIRLEDTCDECGRPWPPLSGRSRPGYCAWCQSWLGRSLENHAVNVVDTYKLWCSHQISDLVYKMNLIKEPFESDTVSRALKSHLRLDAGRNLSTVADFTGCTRSALGWWIDGTIRPRLESFFRLCYALDCPPSTLFFPCSSDSLPTNEFSHRPEVRDRITSLIPPPKMRPGRPKGASQTALFRLNDADPRNRLYLKHALALAVETGHCVAPGEIAKQLGYSSVRQIRRKFPDLNAALNRHRSIQTESMRITIRERLRNALLEQPPPTLANIAAGLNKSSSTALRAFEPALCEKILANREEWKHEQLKRAGLLLEAANKADLIVPLQRFCSSAELSFSMILAYLPEHKRRYDQRYRSLMADRRLQKDEDLSRKIAAAVVELQGCGLFPSVSNVLKLTPSLKHAGWDKLQKGIKDALA
jgi:transcriptional regulator with XRE-family HTH domain/AraC-like DNA-binding protein